MDQTKKTLDVTQALSRMSDRKTNYRDIMTPKRITELSNELYRIIPDSRKKTRSNIWLLSFILDISPATIYQYLSAKNTTKYFTETTCRFLFILSVLVGLKLDNER